MEPEDLIKIKPIKWETIDQENVNLIYSSEIEPSVIVSVMPHPKTSWIIIKYKIKYLMKGFRF
jgi:hypothetical protein